jgi:hypothetical protein
MIHPYQLYSLGKLYHEEARVRHLGHRAKAHGREREVERYVVLLPLANKREHLPRAQRVVQQGSQRIPYGCRSVRDAATGSSGREDWTRFPTTPPAAPMGTP